MLILNIRKIIIRKIKRMLKKLQYYNNNNKNKLIKINFNKNLKINYWLLIKIQRLNNNKNQYKIMVFSLLKLINLLKINLIFNMKVLNLLNNN